MLTKLWDFFFHRHKWIILDKIELWGNGDTPNMPVGTRYHLQCKTCSELIKKDLK